MAPYYPVYLDLVGKPCVVIGGGDVAERKVRGLVECDAGVTVISPEATLGIRELAEQGGLIWEDREYRQGDLKGVFLAIAATDQSSVNQTIADEAANEGVILNVVDNASLCGFIAPAILRRGEVTVALSTGGASPALARKIRESLEHSDALEYANLAGILSLARGELKRQGVVVDPNRWQECISGELVSLVKAGKEQQALHKLMSNLVEGSQTTANSSASGA